LPLAFEIEYAYRGVGASGDETRLDLHTLGANMLFDGSDLVGPFGVYAGAGIGARIERVHFRSTSGTSSTAINGSGFFWQAMGGVTVSVAREAQLYGGVRFMDAGTLRNDEFRVNTQALNYEFGFRFFF
jgi:opacity protein-like surface antigen